jgi:hypothetical protein
MARIYKGTVGPSFGRNVDWGQIQKINASGEVGKYSPAIRTGTKRRVLKGDPDPDRISTSYVERQNLTMRMGMRRFTRLTNGFSRKIENLAHAVSLHFMHYKFARPHATLKQRYPRRPPMAGLRWLLAWPVTSGRWKRSRLREAEFTGQLIVPRRRYEGRLDLKDLGWLDA